MTGRAKLDLPGEYLAGVHDMDADGVPELFLTRTRGPLIKNLPHFRSSDSRTARWFAAGS
jgi:hypothetical protein